MFRGGVRTAYIFIAEEFIEVSGHMLPPSFRAEEFIEVSGVLAAYIFITEECIEVSEEHATSILRVEG
jgi:hypothetical protein